MRAKPELLTDDHDEEVARLWELRKKAVPGFPSLLCHGLTEEKRKEERKQREGEE